MTQIVGPVLILWGEGPSPPLQNNYCQKIRDEGPQPSSQTKKSTKTGNGRKVKWQKGKSQKNRQGSFAH